MTPSVSGFLCYGDLPHARAGVGGQYNTGCQSLEVAGLRPRWFSGGGHNVQWVWGTAVHTGVGIGATHAGRPPEDTAAAFFPPARFARVGCSYYGCSGSYTSLEGRAMVCVNV